MVERHPVGEREGNVADLVAKLQGGAGAIPMGPGPEADYVDEQQPPLQQPFDTQAAGSSGADMPGSRGYSSTAGGPFGQEGPVIRRDYAEDGTPRFWTPFPLKNGWEVQFDPSTGGVVRDTQGNPVLQEIQGRRIGEQGPGTAKRDIPKEDEIHLTVSYSVKSDDPKTRQDAKDLMHRALDRMTEPTQAEPDHSGSTPSGERLPAPYTDGLGRVAITREQGVMIHEHGQKVGYAQGAYDAARAIAELQGRQQPENSSQPTQSSQAPTNNPNRAGGGPARQEAQPRSAGGPAGGGRNPGNGRPGPRTRQPNNSKVAALASGKNTERTRSSVSQEADESSELGKWQRLKKDKRFRRGAAAWMIFVAAPGLTQLGIHSTTHYVAEKSMETAGAATNKIIDGVNGTLSAADKLPGVDAPKIPKTNLHAPEDKYAITGLNGHSLKAIAISPIGAYKTMYSMVKHTSNAVDKVK